MVFQILVVFVVLVLLVVLLLLLVLLVLGLLVLFLIFLILMVLRLLMVLLLFMLLLIFSILVFFARELVRQAFLLLDGLLEFRRGTCSSSENLGQLTDGQVTDPRFHINSEIRTALRVDKRLRCHLTCLHLTCSRTDIYLVI